MDKLKSTVDFWNEDTEGYMGEMVEEFIEEFPVKDQVFNRVRAEFIVVFRKIPIEFREKFDKYYDKIKKLT